ncbi:MAG TPA: 2,3-bisphosphoglycerate-independent phosphoglycerate mutase [Candidatus Kapabacteria bacterium]|nr:2,3-bisphosphoglycerate-independent phosphoglycerate mutase [Candidatus Kapabacteria bacterium]
MSEHRPKPVVLAILDGWGVAAAGDGNAITRAKTPNIDRFVREFPVMTLYASGNEVGLSFGEMGNSEVGHLNIGAGRVYYQTFPRINKSIQDQSFFENKAFLQAIDHVKQNGSKLHLIGLVSPGNVHASEDHCYALLELAKKEKIKDVFVHPILDGRDTTYNSGIDFIRRLEDKMKEVKRGEIASVSGRYYAMDRDNRWERVEKAYRAMVDGVADEYYADASTAITASYARGVYDEEFVPVVIGKEGHPTARVEEGDAVIFFNFRPDRARQLTQAFVIPGFSKFERTYMKNLFFVTMTEYEKEIPVTVAFPPAVVHNCLAEVVSKAGLSQFHIAETEKYAHITFFLNGTIEEPFPDEARKIIPSPKVSSYEKAPEMSAGEIAKETVKAIESKTYDVIFVNFANADMVGHTGDIAATVQGCEAIDNALGSIADHVLAHDGVLLITADHGNAEEMLNLQTKERDKEHSTNPVPFFVIGNKYKGQAGPAGDPPEGDLSLMHPVGMLADVAPTMLSILEIDVPPDMTGRPLM